MGSSPTAPVEPDLRGGAAGGGTCASWQMGTVVEGGAAEVHHEVTRTKERMLYIVDRTAIIDPLRK